MPEAPARNAEVPRAKEEPRRATWDSIRKCARRRSKA
jgi:hypothetical protein